MASIRPLNMRLLEDIFDMGSGYVLDFSNRSFADFFEHEVGIAIYDDRYAVNGTSKANRLRVFLNTASSPLAGRVLRALWEYRQAIRGATAVSDEKARQWEERFFKLVHALDGKGGPMRPQATTPSPCLVNPSQPALADLSRRLLALSNVQGQTRGFAFEKFLNELFMLYNLNPRRSFRLVGEQIDGSFELPPETYLLEAKWQGVPVGVADLLAFSGKVEGKAQWSRGLFISYGDFSADGLQAFARGRPTNIVCMNGLDLAQVLSGGLSLVDVIQRKKRRAAETGSAFVPVRDLFLTVT